MLLAGGFEDDGEWPPPSTRKARKGKGNRRSKVSKNKAAAVEMARFDALDVAAGVESR